jgi:hypothetical protein
VVTESGRRDTEATVYDLQKVRHFLDLAKTLIHEGVCFEQKFGEFSVAYDGYWTRYRNADDVVRCELPEDTTTITVSGFQTVPETVGNSSCLEKNHRTLKSQLIFLFRY